jgi:hypothetical protein
MTRNTGRAQCAHTVDPCNRVARHPSIASGVNHTVRLPRARRPASYSAQLVTRWRCLGMWWRRSACALNGKRGAPAGWRGLAPASPYPKPAQVGDRCNKVPRR